MSQRSLNVKNLLKPNKFKLGSFWIGPNLFLFFSFSFFFFNKEETMVDFIQENHVIQLRKEKRDIFLTEQWPQCLNLFYCTSQS